MTSIEQSGDGRLPNLLIVGAPKSGTTTLHRVLSDHPDIYMSRVKEPTFFSSQRHYARGIDWYSSEFFASAGGVRLRGEATPWYLYSADAVTRIASDLEAAAPRIIVVLREPVARAYSMYWDQVAAGHESRSFEDAVNSQSMGPADVMEQPEIPNADVRCAYLTCSRYTDFLRVWHRTFAPRLLVLIQEELITRTPTELERLWRFLDVPARDLTELPRENTASQPVSRTVERGLRLVERVPQRLRRAVAEIVGDERTRRIAGRLARANRQPSGYPPLDPELGAELRRRLRGDLTRLEDLLGRELDVWR